MEEAWKKAKQPPELSFESSHLLDAYVELADPAKEGSTESAMALLDELLATSRASLAEGSPELAQELSWACMRLLPLRVWDAAEPMLREVLQIREKVQPDVWTTFNTKSMLGEALLGQKRYAEAEPLLLDGYRGMKEREPAVIKQNGVNRIVQALERLVKFYEAEGNASEAAAWREKFEAARATAPKPNRKGR